MAFLGPNSPIPTKGKGAKLTPKMVAFIDEYLANGVVRKAVLAAGYKTNNPTMIGTRLINHPLVAQEIERRQAERREKLEITADYLLNKLINVIEDEGTKNVDLLRAIELAGKSIALWKERQEISGVDGKAIEMEQKIKEDVADFTSAIARLADREGKSRLASVPNTGTEG